MILIHPHALGNIMGSAQSVPDDAPDHIQEIKRKTKRSDDEKAVFENYKNSILSAGAKTYLSSLAKEIVYGYKSKVHTKEMEKGIRCEQDSIDLYNSVFFTMHAKNSERRESDILSGEPDIIDEDIIKDIKTSWSLETFPATKDKAHDDGYEWQGRAYMMLFDKPRFELAFCMVSTPEDLYRYESPDVHCVDHIPPNMRITRVIYERDAEKEMLIDQKCKQAQVFVEQMIAQINCEHKQ